MNKKLRFIEVRLFPKNVARCRQAKHDSYWSGLEIQRPQSFTPMSTSFKDLPFLYEITGGFLNIFRSEGVTKIPIIHVFLVFVSLHVDI